MKDKFLRDVMGALGEGNARLVGGCVRDTLSKRTIKDIDVATPKLPENVIKLLNAKGIRTVPTGIKHGTVTAVSEKNTIEITTLRKDIECDGRHAEVEFTDDWEQDAARRDFTINAMSMDLEGGVFDYFSGADDLRRGIIRFVGDPDKRVQEDYLRILRYFRFEALYGTHAIDKASLDACVKYQHNIDTLSGERIGAEMIKLLSADDPYFVLIKMRDTGVLKHVIPGVSDEIDLLPLKHLIIIEKEEGFIVPDKDVAIRLALMIEGGIKQAESLCERWRSSNLFKKMLIELVDPLIDIPASMNEKEQKRLMVQIGRGSFIRQLIYSWARDEDNHSAIRFKKMLAFCNTWKVPEFPLRGKDLLDIGFRENEQLGIVLKKAHEVWQESDYKLTRAKLLTMVKKKIIN